LFPEFDKPPSTSLNHFFAQPAGFMASQYDIWHWTVNLCDGGQVGLAVNNRNSTTAMGVGGLFLPPFEDRPGMMSEDGFGYQTDHVEYWSGGMQLYGPTCKIQRVVSLEQFDRHLMYHTANNKQRELSRSNRLVSVPTLWGQLQTVKLAAYHEMMSILEKRQQKRSGNLGTWISNRLLS
jgi:hypothetical protein